MKDAPATDKLGLGVIGLGVIGLGRAFMLMLPTLANHPDLKLAAAADPRGEARDAFSRDFGAATYDSVEALCADSRVEAVYIASPHQFHVAHTIAAARAGKHILVEKPMALTLADCQTMIAAARDAGVRLMVGHSHSFDAPYLEAAKRIASGDYGAVRMITAMNFTDFLYRPRRAEELDTAQGGGVVFSQGAHQIDIVRLLGGGMVRSVRAMTGRWDASRPTEGAYQALLTFENGASASLTYNGYGRFDTDAFTGWIGEMGQQRDPALYGTARAALRKVSSPEEEAALKNTRAYGLAPVAMEKPAGRQHNHFGLFVISCDHADIRPQPGGLEIYGDDARSFEPLPPPDVPRAEVIDELYAALRHGKPPLHSGQWGMATLEVCLALLQSASTGKEIALAHQCAPYGLASGATG